MIDKILGVGVVVTAMIGSTIIAMDIGLNWLGYSVFIIHSVLALTILERSKAPMSIVITTGYFAVVNLVGVVRYGLAFISGPSVIGF